MQLEGSLEQFPLAELIGMIAGSTVTGVLAIGERPTTTKMFCRDGVFYHAQTETAQGFAAVCQILAIPRALFQFTDNSTCDVFTIHMHPDEFAAQVERRATQWSEVRQQIKGLDWVPMACVPAEQVSEQFDKATRVVFAAIDGQRNVSALVKLLGLDELEISTMLSTMVTQELVRMEPPRTLAVPTALEQQSALLKRMLAKTAAEKVPASPVEKPVGLLHRWGFSRR